jgi:hypothetical protein
MRPIWPVAEWPSFLLLTHGKRMAAFAQLRTFAVVCHTGRMTTSGMSFAGYTFATDKACFACKHVTDDRLRKVVKHKPAPEKPN